MNQQLLQDMKNFNWNKIIKIGNSIDDLNDAQWRFMKGLVAELAVEANAGKDGPTYVGAPHKDYDWDKYKVSIELKSILSASMYYKRGDKLKKNYTVKLNNSNGTNKLKTLPKEHVSDYLIVLANDGAFVIDQATVLKHAKRGGDGFSVTVPNSVITELSGKIVVTETKCLNLKAIISDAIRDALTKESI